MRTRDSTVKSAWLCEFPQPRMRQGLCQGQPVYRILPQKCGDEASGFGRKTWPILGVIRALFVGGEGDGSFEDAAVGLFATWSRKWRKALQQLIGQHTQAPDINTKAVAIDGVDDLWRQIVQCAAKCPSLLIWISVYCPAKITKLDLAAVSDENVLRLQVSMYHMHSVAILDGSRDLSDEWRGVVLTEALVWLLQKPTGQITSMGMLQDHEDV